MGKNREGLTATTTPALKDPTTNIEYVEAQDEARLLKATFFPTAPEPDLEDINGAEYQDQIPFPDTIQKEVYQLETRELSSSQQKLAKELRGYVPQSTFHLCWLVF